MSTQLRFHRPAVVVCDLDGTLVDSTAAMSHSVRVGCRAVGVCLDPQADLGWCVGPRIEDSLRQLVGSDRMLEAREAFRKEYRCSGPSLTQVMPGARAALGHMGAAGLRLGVATYKPEPLATMILQALELAPLFATIRGRRIDVEDERPKAAVLADALAALGAGPAEVLYIGDHDEDEVAAATVGVEFIRYGPVDWRTIATAVLGFEAGAAR